MVHAIWSSVFVFIVEKQEEDTQPNDGGQEGQKEWNFEAWNDPSIAASSGVAHCAWIEQEQAVQGGEDHLEHRKRQEHAPAEFQDLIGSNSSQRETSPNEHDEEHEPRLEQHDNGARNQHIGFTKQRYVADGALERQVPSSKEEVGEQETCSVGADVFGIRNNTQIDGNEGFDLTTKVVASMPKLFVGVCV